MRAFSAAALGLPVSQTSVGSLTFSWSMVPADAMVGTVKSAAAAVERKAVREMELELGSAWRAVLVAVLVLVVGAGANAAADPRVARMVMLESFILCSGKIWNGMEDDCDDDNNDDYVYDGLDDWFEEKENSNIRVRKKKITKFDIILRNFKQYDPYSQPCTVLLTTCMLS